MSALGHKQTFTDFRMMSALSPKADINERRSHCLFLFSIGMALGQATAVDGEDAHKRWSVDPGELCEALDDETPYTHGQEA
jgi:hypothetical protein